MRKLLLGALVCVGMISSAFANPSDDAKRIVELTVTEDLFGAAFEAQWPFIVAALEGSLRKADIEISDSELFLEVVIEEMLAAYTRDMQVEFHAYYLSNFSGEELAGIRAFYESAAGRALLDGTPGLMQHGATYGAKAGAKAAQAAGPRIADRVEKEGLEVVKPSVLDRFLKQLR